MSNTQTVDIDIVRTLAFGGISGVYAPIGGPLTHPVRLICFTNNTNGDVFISDDGVNNKLFIAAGSFKLFDLTTNRYSVGQMWVFRNGTQFSVAQSTAPTSGAVYIECLWGE